jgi:hypothetical protein
VVPPDEDLWIDQPHALATIMGMDIPGWIKEGAIKFIRDGFVVIRGGLSPEQCKVAVESFNKKCWDMGASCQGKRDALGHLPRITNAHTVVPEVLDLILQNKEALQMQDFLFGSKTSVYTSLLFTRGTQQTIHIDIPFFWTYPKNRYFGVWTALENVDEGNGPLRVLVGGHKCHMLDQRDKIPRIVEKKAQGQLSQVDEEAFYVYATATLQNCALHNVSAYQEVHLQIGDTIIWHPLLPHGGQAIKNMNRTRVSLVAHTVPEMTPVYHTDAFFFPEWSVPPTANWPYDVVKARNGVPDYRLVGAGERFRFTMGTGY